jgi:predicted ATPase
MIIDRIAITAYRSLYEVEFKPGHLTVFTGPNNAGKTNLVEAIDFLAEAHLHDLELAVSRKGGIENITHRRMRRTRVPLSFEIEAHFNSDEVQRIGFIGAATRRGAQKYVIPPIRINHRFEITAESRAIEAGFSITREEVELRDASPGGDQILFAIERDAEVRIIRRDLDRPDPFVSDLLFPVYSEGFDYGRLFRATRPTDLITKNLYVLDVFQQYAMNLARTRLYQLVPLECRKPGVPTPNAELDRHGSNLPAIVAHLRRNDKRAWSRTLAAMRRIVPGLEDIKTDFTPDRRLALQFVESGVARPWSSEDISDGTIQSLALYAALFDRRAPLILIEEPENSVHPWIIRSFIDSCREAHGKQILITTHSPALINYLRPEEVSLVWRRAGRTYLEPLTRLDPQAENLWEQGKSTVFELLDSGWLPQSVPGDDE